MLPITVINLDHHFDIYVILYVLMESAANDNFLHLFFAQKCITTHLKPICYYGSVRFFSRYRLSNGQPIQCI